MTALKEGMKAPDFKLPADDGTILSLKDYRGQKLVLYFYPKDDTPGCTTEACAFNDGLPAFKKLNAVILGVSKDPVAKHRKFREKYGLKFPLVSDEDGTVIEKYGVWVEKSMYGKKYMGIERATFLIDEEGKIERIWHKVRVAGHAEDVKAALKS
ncbi:MAG: thioredoxin-dependent thiol peroxidase [Micavibrio sp.]